jgi:hypothetical protein
MLNTKDMLKPDDQTESLRQGTKGYTELIYF